MKFLRTTLSLLALSTYAAVAQTDVGVDPLMAEYYDRQEIPLPKGEVMEIGSIALMPEQRVAVSTRRGDIWICDGAYGDDLSQVSWTLYYRGLHEPLGMFWQAGSLFVSDREQFCKLTDKNGDDRADVVETITDDWGLNGNYHEYAFGSTPDKDGNVWVVLCLTGSSKAETQWRGWCMKITPEGDAIPTVSGIRSPGGIGYDAEGHIYYTDNQGLWNGTSCLKPLVPGKFTGNPSGNKFYKDAPHMGERPLRPNDKSRIVTERERIPELVPPAVHLPHSKLGQSPTAIAPDLTGGKFGPFQNQVLVGEQTHSEVQRVYFESVNGVRQGAVWKLLSGFRCGIIPMRLSQDGSLFVGGSNRGWASKGGKPFTFERVRWTGETPFEMKTMEARKEGFHLSFTEPVDKKLAADPANYSMEAWCYIYQAGYGSPEVDQVTPVIESAKVAKDGLSVELTITGLTKGHVHHLDAHGVKSKSGKALWHKDAYYTLNEIPAE